MATATALAAFVGSHPRGSAAGGRGRQGQWSAESRAVVAIGRSKFGRLYSPLISWSRRVQPGNAMLSEVGSGVDARSDSGSNAIHTFRLVLQIRRCSLALESSHPAAASIVPPRGATDRQSRGVAPAAAGLSPEDAAWLKAPVACARRS